MGALDRPQLPRRRHARRDRPLAQVSVHTA